MSEVSFGYLKGRTLVSIKGAIVGHDRVIFEDDSGESFLMWHNQDCCERVSIEDITGDVDDLIGSPITMAEEESNSDNPPECSESHTWTFYKLATIKGYVTFRWLGTSNGYYSESVSFERVHESA